MFPSLAPPTYATVMQDPSFPLPAANNHNINQQNQDQFAQNPRIIANNPNNLHIHNPAPMASAHLHYSSWTHSLCSVPSGKLYCMSYFCLPCRWNRTVTRSGVCGDEATSRRYYIVMTIAFILWIVGYITSFVLFNFGYCKDEEACQLGETYVDFSISLSLSFYIPTSIKVKVY